MGKSGKLTDYNITNFISGELSPRLQGRVDIKSYIQGCKTIRDMIVLPQGGVTRRPGIVTEKLLGTAVYAGMGFSPTPDVNYILILDHFEINVYKHTNKTRWIYDPEMEWTLYAALPWPSTLAINLPEIKTVINNNTIYFFCNEMKPTVLTYTGTTFTLALWAPDVTAFTTPFVATSPLVAGGYPGCGTIYEGRLLISGSIDYPDLYHGTVAGNYDSFPTPGSPITDADAYEKRVSISGSSAVEWMQNIGALVFGTDAGIATRSSRQELMTSLTSSFTLMASAYGASSQQGFLMGGEVFYIQKGERKIRMAQYNANTETYLTPDLLGHAEHITQSRIKKAVYMQNPESILWLLLEDGNLASMTYDQSSGMLAWATHITEGKTVDIFISDGPESSTLMLITEKDIFSHETYLESMDTLFPLDIKDNNFLNKSIKHLAGPDMDIGYIEARPIVIGPDTFYSPTIYTFYGSGFDIMDGSYVKIYDSGFEELDYKMFKAEMPLPTHTDRIYLKDVVTDEYILMDDFPIVYYTGRIVAVSNSVTGLTTFAGEEIDYSIDGGDGGKAVVSAGGVLELSSYGNKIMIGHTYASYIIPMNFAGSKNKQKRIAKISAELYNSVGGKAGKTLESLDPLPTTEVVVLDDPPNLNNGIIKIPFRGGSSYDGDLILLQDRPLPFTVLSIIAEVEIGE